MKHYGNDEQRVDPEKFRILENTVNAKVNTLFIGLVGVAIIAVGALFFAFYAFMLSSH